MFWRLTPIVWVVICVVDDLQLSTKLSHFEVEQRQQLLHLLDDSATNRNCARRPSIACRLHPISFPGRCIRTECPMHSAGGGATDPRAARSGAHLSVEQPLGQSDCVRREKRTEAFGIACDCRCLNSFTVEDDAFWLSTTFVARSDAHSLSVGLLSTRSPFIGKPLSRRKIGGWLPSWHMIDWGDWKRGTGKHGTIIYRVCVENARPVAMERRSYKCNKR